MAVVKHIYFVRHGETKRNAEHIHQLPEEPLNEVGKQQANAVADYFTQHPIDALYASPYVRARETAECIQAKIGVPLSPLASVVEFRRPDSLYGRRHTSIGSLRYLYQFFINRHNQQWEYQRAENIYDITNRVLDAKKELAATAGDQIVVVTHSIFMNLFVALACRQINLSLHEYIKGILNTMRTKNTEIFHLQYDPNAPSNTCAWQLVEKIAPTQQ